MIASPGTERAAKPCTMVIRPAPAKASEVGIAGTVPGAPAAAMAHGTFWGSSCCVASSASWLVLVGGALVAATTVAVAPQVRDVVGANRSVADFYLHRGVNARAVLRALTRNVSSGEIRQGGSTITQQLVKNALLSSDRDINRKSKEVVLAVRLEQELSKQQILEKYLNTVYFGAGAYGVEAAAETSWGVHASQLGYAEGAMLAAVIANPVGYDPTLHPPGGAEAAQLRHPAPGRAAFDHRR